MEGRPKYEAEYDGDEKIRAEFSSKKTYVLFREKEDAGLVKILTREGVVRSSEKPEPITPAVAVSIIQTWKTDPTVRAEFRSFNAYRAYRERFPQN